MVTHVLFSCGMLVMGKAVHVWSQKGMWETSVLNSQFICESKTEGFHGLRVGLGY